jgi:hypothetical protein
MLLKQGFEQSPNVKILINIGALLDIPTGTYITGLHGESILNGGLGQMTGVVGIGNNFKSTVMHYMMLSAMNRISFTTPTSASTYDTEINIHESHLRALTKRFENFKSNDVTNDGTWTFTDKTVYYANEWYTVLKEFLKSKKSNYKQISVTTPFPDRDGKTLLSIATPTFSEIDSFSEFETADIAKMQSENELGDSGANTMHMRQGLAKTRFLMELPAITASVYHFVLMTAHVGKDIAMASGPIPTAPVKKLQNLKNGDKIKGVTDKFFFLMSNCWHAYNAAPLINQGTKGPEYPRNPDDNNTNDTDLNVVSLRQLRSKSGPSGNVIELLVSQSEGVLPELSEFHFLKSAERFGISGTLQHYALDLLPEVKLSRTTVRSKIDTMPELRRALNITAELCQMTLLWRSSDRDILCTPKELYDDLIKLGYDWDMILKNTRGWWTVDNDKYSQHFLSTKDLLLCRAGLYHPYWLEADKKTIKKQYLKN